MFMQTIFIPTWLSVTVLLALLNQGVWKKCAETFFFRAVKSLSLTKQQMLVSLDGIWFGEVGNASPTIIIMSKKSQGVRSMTKIHSSLIIYFFIFFHATLFLNQFSSTNFEIDLVLVTAFNALREHGHVETRAM